MSKPTSRQLIESVGSVRTVANICKVSPRTVFNWKRKDNINATARELLTLHLQNISK
jgi:hypothetical protein